MFPVPSCRRTSMPAGQLADQSRQVPPEIAGSGSACFPWSVETVHAVRRADASIEVSEPQREPFVLPASLGELFLMLTAEGGRRPEGDRSSVGFKSSQRLVHALGTRLNRIVSRRHLVRWVAALRRALDLHSVCGQRRIESRRGFGWRLNVPVLGPNAVVNGARRASRAAPE